MKIEPINVLILIGATQSFLMAVVYFWKIRKSNKNVWSGFFFLSNGFLFFYIGLYVSDYFLEHPLFFHTEIPLLYLLGPLGYLMFKLYIEDKESPEGNFWLHFILPVAVTAVMVPFYLDSDEAKLGRIAVQLDLTQMNLPKLIQGLSAVSLFCYGFLLLKKSWAMMHWDVLRTEKSARIVVLMIVLMVEMLASLLITALLKSPIPLGLGASIAALAFIFISLIGNRNPEYLLEFKNILAREKKKYSFLGKLDIEKIGLDIRQLMEEQQIYTDENLSIKDLAEETSLSVHQLSEYLNTIEGKGFFHFVNEFRVKHAQRLLREDPARSILTIAYEVGFNSKTAFNKAFRKISGQSPKAFRAAIKAD